MRLGLKRLGKLRGIIAQIIKKPPSGPEVFLTGADGVQLVGADGTPLTGV